MSRSPYLSNPNILAHPDRIVQTVELDLTAQESYLAGSPINAEGKLANDETAIGILLYDVRKRAGSKRGVVVVSGRINQEAAAAWCGITISDAAKSALVNITFSDDGSRMGGGGGGGASSWDDLGYNADGTINHINPDFIEYMYGKKSVVTEIIPETKFTFEDGMYQFSEEFTLTLGETYTVCYNGTTYECVCVDLMGQFLALGNAPSFGLESTEPFGFLVAIGQGISALIDANDATEAVFSLSGIVTEVTKVPNEFIDTTPFFDLTKFDFPILKVGETVTFVEEMPADGDVSKLMFWSIYFALQKGPVRLRTKIDYMNGIYMNTIYNGSCSEGQSHIYATSVHSHGGADYLLTIFDISPLGASVTVKQLTL